MPNTVVINVNPVRVILLTELLIENSVEVSQSKLINDTIAYCLLKTLDNVFVNGTWYGIHPSFACVNTNIGVTLPIAKSGNYTIVAGYVEMTIFRRVSRVSNNIKFKDILFISTYWFSRLLFIIIMDYYLLVKYL